jgi:CRP/FNR family nitrogen fixation transcriptional regulator
MEYVAVTDVRVARDLLSITANDLRRADDHMLLLGRKLALEKVAAFCWIWTSGWHRLA